MKKRNIRLRNYSVPIRDWWYMELLYITPTILITSTRCSDYDGPYRTTREISLCFMG